MFCSDCNNFFVWKKVSIYQRFLCYCVCRWREESEEMGCFSVYYHILVFASWSYFRKLIALFYIYIYFVWHKRFKVLFSNFRFFLIISNINRRIFSILNDCVALFTKLNLGRLNVFDLLMHDLKFSKLCRLKNQSTETIVQWETLHVLYCCLLCSWAMFNSSPFRVATLCCTFVCSMSVCSRVLFISLLCRVATLCCIVICSKPSCSRVMLISSACRVVYRGSRTHKWQHSKSNFDATEALRPQL